LGDKRQGRTTTESAIAIKTTPYLLAKLRRLIIYKIQREGFLLNTTTYLGEKFPPNYLLF